MKAGNISLGAHLKSAIDKVVSDTLNKAREARQDGEKAGLEAFPGYLEELPGRIYAIGLGKDRAETGVWEYAFDKICLYFQLPNVKLKSSFWYEGFAAAVIKAFEAADIECAWHHPTLRLYVTIPRHDHPKHVVASDYPEALWCYGKIPDSYRPKS